MRKLTILVLILLCGCRTGNIPEPPETPDTSDTTEETTASTWAYDAHEYSQSETITTSEISALPYIQSFPEVAINGETPFLSIHQYFEGYWRTELTLTVYHYAVLEVTDEFIKLISENEYSDWMKRSDYDGFNYDYERLYVSWVDLDDFSNLYTFICEYNLSEQQIRDALLEWNEFGVADMVEKYIYSKEEIEAIATKNKEEITKLFATSLAIVKGDKIYVPGWFFYSSVEDYMEANITPNDLITVLDNCRNFKFYRSERHFGEWNFGESYLLDLTEYKAYRYLGGNVDVVKLCGYDRDFDMLMAFEGYYETILKRDDGYKRYDSFFNTAYEYDTSHFNIIKGDNAYSPHWVYYNKPAAYKEAGITHAELVAMLPRYKSLGILSDEAYAALERKINEYGARL